MFGYAFISAPLYISTLISCVTIISHHYNRSILLLNNFIFPTCACAAGFNNYHNNNMEKINPARKNKKFRRPITS